MSMNNELKNKVVSFSSWEEERLKIKTSKQEINKLIFNYLILEANKEAVEEFEKETGQTVEYDKELLSMRSDIRKLLLKGDIDSAINLINDIDENILQGNKKLNFELLKLKLVGMIKLSKVEDAIKFAQQTLFPLAVNDELNLSELKKLMVLLVYDDINNSPFKDILSDNYIKTVISCINIEILKSRLQTFHPSLQILIKLMKWSQKELRDCNISFPEVTSITPLQYK
jgi:hypothetical protein